MSRINQTALGKVRLFTAQHCWDRTEAAARWTDRSSLLPQTPPATVYLREEQSLQLNENRPLY